MSWHALSWYLNHPQHVRRWVHASGCRQQTMHWLAVIPEPVVMICRKHSSCTQWPLQRQASLQQGDARWVLGRFRLVDAGDHFINLVTRNSALHA